MKLEGAEAAPSNFMQGVETASVSHLT